MCRRSAVGSQAGLRDNTGCQRRDHDRFCWSDGKSGSVADLYEPATDAASGAQGRSSRPHRYPIAAPGLACPRVHQAAPRRRRRPAQPEHGWSRRATRSPVGMMPAWRCATLAQPVPPSAAGTRWPERSRHTAGLAARDRSRAEGGIRGSQHERHRIATTMRVPSGLGLHIGAGEGNRTLMTSLEG
jgi:hypothetical protein